MKAAEEPLGGSFWPDGDARGFSLLSRGDRVHGWLARPESAGPCPLVLVAGPDGCATSDTVAAAARAFGAWAAVAAIDLPLCGARRSEKLALEDLDREGAVGARLRGDVELQAESDLARALGFLRDALPGARAGFFGSGMGARLALGFCRSACGLDAAALAGDPSLAEQVRASLGERGKLFPPDASLDAVGAFLASRLR